MSDLISRDAAVAALEREMSLYPDNRIRYNTNKDATDIIRALPAAPAPQPWTEEQLAEAMYDDTHFAGGWRTSTQVERELCFAHARVALAGPVKP